MDTNDAAPDARVWLREQRWIFGWSAVVLLLATITAVGVAREMARNRLNSAAAHRERLNPAVVDSAEAAANPALPPGAAPLLVHAGIYVDRIPELKVKEAEWTVDFYIWFSWTGADVHPGDNFTVVDGWIEEREKVDEFHAGDRHYVRYRAVARISKFFDVRRFPLDNHLLTLNIECPAYRRMTLRFVPDSSSSVSSRVQVAAYRIGATTIIETPHRYASTMGDPRLPASAPAVHSQLRLGIPLNRLGWAFFIKLFQGTLASIAVAAIVFFIRPTNLDPRFGLGVGAFFAAIANSYVTSSLIPDTGIMTLADALNGIAMVLIFLTMVQSALSLHLSESRDDPALSRRFDRVSVVGFVVATLLLFVAIPWSAVGL